MSVRSFSSYLHASDVLIIGYAAALSLINLLFSARISHWAILILINFGVTAVICALAFARHRTGWKVLRYVHDWYVPFMVLVAFKELYYMVNPIHGRDYDDWLIAADRWLFGVDPTVWIAQFAMPWLTELLQIAYTSFYFLFLLLGYELYKRGNMDVFHYFMFTCVYGFFLSYLGYFTLPAIGPRFTLHDFANLNRDLPGLFLTPHLRWFVNWAESIPMGVPNDVAIALTQRDVFPSGHTMMTLVLVYFGFHHRVRTRWFLFATAVLLIAATVYQQYHYVVDLFAGALFMVVCVLTSPALYRWVEDGLGTMEHHPPRM
jgi:membrane-associated phospholipid phosphatase